MTNYDYNKGYRAFRFKKNNNIDKNLPALKTYLETREKTDIFWITNSERVVENIEKSLSPPKERYLAGKISADNASSVLYFPRIVSTTPLGNMSVVGSKVPDEDSMEGMVDKYSLAPINVTPASVFQQETPGPETPREKVGPSNSVVKRKTPRDFSYGETKTRRQNQRVKQRNALSHYPRNREIYLRNKKLEECLVIQNGIEKNSREKFGESKLLSREKTEDIMNWMDKMPT